MMSRTMDSHHPFCVHRVAFLDRPPTSILSSATVAPFGLNNCTWVHQLQPFRIDPLLMQQRQPHGLTEKSQLLSDMTSELVSISTRDEEGLPLTASTAISPSTTPSPIVSTSPYGHTHSSSSSTLHIQPSYSSAQPFNLLPAPLTALLDRIGTALSPPGLQAAIREHDHAYTLTPEDPDEVTGGRDYALPTAATNLGGHSRLDRAGNPDRSSCTFPRTNIGKFIAVLVIVSIFLFLDVFIIRKPYGLIAWHEWTGSGRSQSPAQKCGWDYEASWKIGMVHGSSPLSYTVVDPHQPTIDCSSISHIPASFVADPFLFVPSNTFPAHPPLARGGKASPPVPGQFVKEPGQCDLSKAQLPPERNGGGRRNPDGSAKCYNTGLTSLTGDPNVDTDPWYLFYEIKNLKSRSGELGASVSYDQGANWDSVGTILRETMPNNPNQPLHLSYPQVFPAYEPHTNQVELLMVPETHNAQELRIYKTDACCFPYGWTLATVKLSGQHFVDTSIVYYQDRWYIFTSVEYTLSLYVSTGAEARSLIRSDWILHPASPLYTHDRHFGRNGGRIIPHDGGLIRFSQDCSGFYGEKLHTLRINRLTPQEFEEEWVSTSKPLASTKVDGSPGLLGDSQAGLVHADYLTNRIHHMDWLYLRSRATDANGAPLPGRWIGVIDGDNIPDDYHFWKQEGWFWTLKLVVLVFVTGVTLYLMWKHFILHLYVIRPFQKWWALFKIRTASGIRTLIARIQLHIDRMTPVRNNQPKRSVFMTLLCKLIFLLLVIVISFIFAFLLTSFYPFNMSCTIAGVHGGMDLPVSYSYHRLAAKSQAYCEPMTWHKSLETKFNIQLTGDLEQETRALTSSMIESDTTTPHYHTQRVQHILGAALGQSRGQVDGAGNAFSPRPTPFASKEFLPTTPATQVWFVIGSDKGRFDATKNLIASIQFWWTVNAAVKKTDPTVTPLHKSQPHLTSYPPYFLVYDLGLTQEQLEVLKCVRYVRITRLQYALYPPHVRISSSGAWLPFALREVLDTRSKELQVREMDAVLHLDANMEVRGSLAELLDSLYHRGHFMPQKYGVELKPQVLHASGLGRADTIMKDDHAHEHDILKQTSIGMLNQLGITSPAALRELSLCDAGAIGFIKNKAVDSPMSMILSRAITCASKFECIFPSDALSTSHQFEHSLFSTLYVQAGLSCSSSPAYRAPLERLNPDVTLFSSLTSTTRAGGPSARSSTPAPRPLANTGERFIPEVSEGTTAILTRGSRQYTKFLILDQAADDKTHQCTPASDGWEAVPFDDDHDEDALEHPIFPISASQSDSFDAFIKCVHNTLSAEISEPLDFNVNCKSEIADVLSPTGTYRRVPEDSISTSTTPSFVTQFGQRMNCVWFWLLFTAGIVLAVSDSVRYALIANKKRICLVVIFVFFLVGWLPLYRMALNRWGTFAPWNAYMYTYSHSTPHIPVNNVELVRHVNSIDLNVDSFHSAEPAFAVSRQALALPFPYDNSTTTPKSLEPLSPSEILAGPPTGWRPPHRVVVSFTTMPHHVDKLSETIDSLLAQSLLPDAIYLNLPRGKNKRTNQTYEVLPYLKEKYGETVFKILRCEDVGPLTKLVPTLEAESDPQTFVVTVDSDKIYHKDTISTLVWHSYHDPRTAFGICGWSFYWLPPPMEVVPVYVPWLTRGDLGRSVDVLQAVCGNVYRRAFFPDLNLLRHPHPKCFTTDDLWIAGYLSTRSHVKRVIINTPGAYTGPYGSIEPVTVSWKAADPEQWQLSTNNVKPGVDMACIRGVETNLGPWRLIRRMENEVESTYDQPEQGRI